MFHIGPAFCGALSGCATMFFLLWRVEARRIKTYAAMNEEFKKSTDVIIKEYLALLEKQFKEICNLKEQIELLEKSK